MKTTVRLRMVMLPAALALLLTFLTSLSAGVYALSQPGTNPSLGTHSQLANANTAVLTYKNDTFHSGANRNETILTLSNVNPLQFGKRAAFPIDGEAYAQPLFMPNVTIGGSAHNVVFVTTQNDSVYAFDADSTDSSAAPLWKTSFLGGANNAAAVTPADVNCNDTHPLMGILSTPVIDPATSTMYVVAFTKENGTLVDRLHALDLTTGADKASVVISGSVPGGGQGSSGGKISFDPKHERQRANLLLNPVNGQIYMAFASFCDNTPYHGWIMAYSFSNNTFNQTGIYNDTPDGGLGGIWGGAGTLTADPSGNIFFTTGNGTFQTNAHDLGDSFVKLSPDLKTVLDFFTPFNQSCLEAADADLGSGGVLLIPSRNEAIGVGKEGRIYVLSMVRMGHFTSPPSGFSCSNQTATNIDKIIQEFPPHTLGGVFNTPSTWSNGTTQYVYFSSTGQPLKAYVLNGSGKLSLSSQGHDIIAKNSAGNSVVSSNGNSNGIVWMVDSVNGLRAYDAANVGHELYTSSANPARDALTGGMVKFSAPTVANGEVFVATQTALNIYSVLPNTAGNNPNNVGITSDSNTVVGNFDGAGRSYSAQALQSVGVVAGQPVNTNGFTFQWPNVQAGTPDNWYAEGQTIAVSSNSGDNLLGILGAADFGASSGTATMNFTDGTSQSFTLGFTDWWSKTPTFGNKVVVTAPYQNAASGKVTVSVGVFLAQVTIPGGKILQSVVLPSDAIGGQLHVFAFATQKISTSSFNNAGISDDAAPAGGNFDGQGHSYSAQALASVGIAPGNTLNINGYSFQWPNVQPGTADNWLVHGQIVVMNSANGNLLGILGAADFGASSGTATMNFTDGTSQSFTLGFTDWWKWKTLSFNNQVISVAPYQDTASGKLTIPVGIFLAQFSIPSGKVLASVILPSSTTGGQLHVFALATRNASGSDFNNVGISNDAAPAPGNFDGQGRSYSAQALASVGVTAGGTVITSGYSFQWPNCMPGTLDNWLASGQTIPVTPVSGATTLGILGASAFGNGSGTATMRFTDGSSQNFTLGFTDWWRWQTPAFNNGVVVTALYQNLATSGQVNIPVGVFLAEVTIPTGKVLASVTLPSSVTGGKLHVFALATKGAAASSNMPKGKSGLSGRTNFGGFIHSGYIYTSRKGWMW